MIYKQLYPLCVLICTGLLTERCFEFDAERVNKNNLETLKSFEMQFKIDENDSKNDQDCGHLFCLMPIQ